jgi:glucose-6-phosphate isomerase
MVNSIDYNVNKNILAETEQLLNSWANEKVHERVWKKDPTVWRKDPAQQKELADRLGWLDLANTMQNEIPALEEFASEIKSEFDDVVLLGMGGSSLAPEVLFKTFGNKEGYPRLTILDSTHPLSVKKIIETYNLRKTLFLVSSKSGGTVETMSFFYTFFDEIKKIYSKPGRHFVAITDPGSGLENLAKQNEFRKVFSTPSDVGGRYSALTFFGMLPAALIGMDLKIFLSKAKEITDECKPEVEVKNNPGFYLGALMGKLALESKDKLTIFASPKISSFPVWVEQLIAESTGKDEKGILPVADETFSPANVYGNDRVFVFLKLNGDNNSSLEDAQKELLNKKFPVINIELNNVYDLAQEFYRWEMATALSGAALNIHPFDQPNVQLAKTMATESLNAYKSTGSLPEEKPLFVENDLSFYGETNANNAKEFVSMFLNSVKEGDYIAVNAFIPMTKASEDILQDFRLKLRDKYKVATTLGFGPRFLHSTGQLHKGGANNGYFVEINSNIDVDLDVPGQGYSFGILVNAQALGDLKALRSKDRKVIRISISGSIEDGLKKIKNLL